MTTSRRTTRAPYDEARARGERAPDGRPLCRWCGGSVPRPRRNWCSDECVDTWRVRSDPGHARWLVRKRDQGVCAACGLDTEALDRLLRTPDWEYGLPPKGNERRRLRGPARRERDRRMGVPATGHLWEMDHVREVSDGGGGCGLENLQTLCVWCHRAKTAHQAKVRRERQRRLAEGQTLLDG